jgi:hypothetical protein
MAWQKNLGETLVTGYSHLSSNLLPYRSPCETTCRRPRYHVARTCRNRSQRAHCRRHPDQCLDHLLRSAASLRCVPLHPGHGGEIVSRGHQSPENGGL